ncbi:MAG: hypothetical protein RLY43_403 [Bacteroidota bacterium]|jgi:hypothetical protein
MSLPIDHPAVWKALEEYTFLTTETKWSIVTSAYNIISKEWHCEFINMKVEFEKESFETAFLLRYS